MVKDIEYGALFEHVHHPLLNDLRDINVHVDWTEDVDGILWAKAFDIVKRATRMHALDSLPEIQVAENLKALVHHFIPGGAADHKEKRKNLGICLTYEMWTDPLHCPLPKSEYLLYKARKIHEIKVWNEKEKTATARVEYYLKNKDHASYVYSDYTTNALVELPFSYFEEQLPNSVEHITQAFNLGLNSTEVLNIAFNPSSITTFKANTGLILPRHLDC